MKNIIKNIFILVFNGVLIFSLNSCLGDDYELKVTGSGEGTQTGEQTTAVTGSSVNYEKLLANQIACNESGRFYSYTDKFCTNKSLDACSDNDIETTLENGGKEIQNNWAEEFCPKKSESESEDQGTEVTQYRQCNLKKTDGIGTLTIYRIYLKANNKVTYHKCEINNLDFDSGSSSSSGSSNVTSI